MYYGAGTAFYPLMALPWIVFSSHAFWSVACARAAFASGCEQSVTGILLISIAIRAIPIHTPAGAIFPALTAAVILATKWHTERALTARIEEWSSLQDQQSA
ncbi:MAG: hypothetical protein NZ699_06960 [Roseiflexus sp.]|nr:hypothetical protein [Roseiflexus sp.]MDW8146959.1 hypothetical protein [Roseiflexaceae bacterium]